MSELSPIAFVAITFVIALSAGLIGSLLGVGGGIIVVPALSLLILHKPDEIKFAVAASTVGVIATSSGAAAAYVRQHLSNLRVAMFLELSTVAGAVAGAQLSRWVQGKWLYVLFGVLLFYAAAAMFFNHIKPPKGQPPHDALADKLQLHGTYTDARDGKEVPYRVARTWMGLIVSLFAGLISGLLGVGGGILKVPAMNLGMRIPIKVCTATSNFMMGVTAAASAGVYFARGQIIPIVVAPVAAGILVGATAGSTLLPKIHNTIIRVLFMLLLIFMATQMLWKGVRL